MKLKITLLLFLGATISLFSQNDVICLVDDDGCQDFVQSCDDFFYTASTNPDYLSNFQPVVFNIFFWGINETDGSNEPTFTEEHALRKIQVLNLEYNQYNIFFKYKGFDNTSYQDSNRYQGLGANLSGIRTTAVDNGWYREDSFNVYVPLWLNQGGGQSLGYGTTWSAVHHVNMQDADSYTILHEIGHNLDLRHTRTRYWNSSCERVTRNPLDPGYNANIAGDCTTDTAAINCLQEGDWDPEDCVYTGIGEDCDGDLYEIFEADIRNYMSTGAQECRDRFSVGQAIRMREYIAVDPDNILTQVTTDYAALYEPYKGAYSTYNGQVNDNPPLYQPGFNYRFKSCECPELDPCAAPRDYYNTDFSYTETSLSTISKFETDYSSITHPNHSAITIELPLTLTHTQNERRCWDNWNSPPIIGGTITDFHDLEFNNNVTITPVDSIAINSPNLVDDLDPELYNIKKQHIDGSIEETNVLKENN